MVSVTEYLNNYFSGAGNDPAMFAIPAVEDLPPPPSPVVICTTTPSTPPRDESRVPVRKPSGQLDQARLSELQALDELGMLEEMGYEDPRMVRPRSLPVFVGTDTSTYYPVLPPALPPSLPPTFDPRSSLESRSRSRSRTSFRSSGSGSVSGSGSRPNLMVMRPPQDQYDEYGHNPSHGSPASHGSPGSPVPSSMPRQSISDRIVMQFVRHLKKLGIKIVAWDFDDTIVDTDYTPEFYNPINICNRISPLFVTIAQKLLEADIGIAIVTYNDNPHIGPAVSHLLGIYTPVFARADHEIHTGKSWHLTETIQFFNQMLDIADTPDKLTSKNVLLIDDQLPNISVAKINGYSCIACKKVITLDELVNFIDEGGLPPPLPPRL